MFQYRYRKGWPDDGQPFLCKYWPVFTPLFAADAIDNYTFASASKSEFARFENPVQRMVHVCQVISIQMEGYCLGLSRKEFHLRIVTESADIRGKCSPKV